LGKVADKHKMFLLETLG